MAQMNYRVPSGRGANVIAANPQRLESADGKRWATGRNVKRSIANHRYKAVEVWTLKERGPDGKAVTVDTYCDRDEAKKWVTT